MSEALGDLSDDEIHVRLEQRGYDSMTAAKLVVEREEPDIATYLKRQLQLEDDEPC